MDKLKVNVEKGFLLAILPFAGYIIAYSYEKGYLSFFRVPSFLIRLGLEEVIVATSVVIAGLSIFYLILMILYPFRKHISKSAKGFTFLKSIVLFLILSPFISTFSSDSLLDKLIVSYIIFLFILLWQFGFPLLFYKGSSLEEKIIRADKEKDEVGQIEDFIFSRPQLKTIYIIFLTIAYISLLAYKAGVNDASSQKDYLSFSDNTNTYIVVRTYVDKKIAIEISGESKHIENNMRVIFDDANLELNIENIGPLKKEEKRSISASTFSFIENIVNRIFLFFKSGFVNIKQAIRRN